MHGGKNHSLSSIMEPLGACRKWVLIMYLTLTLIFDMGEERFFSFDGMPSPGSKMMYGQYFFNPKAVLERKIPNVRMKKLFNILAQL